MSVARALVWLSGASSGIGAALARNVPWPDARVIGINRRPPAPGVEHLELDLSDPSAWPVAGDAFRRGLAGFDGDRVAFVHAAGSLDPMGFAGEVDGEGYAVNVILNSAAPRVLGHLFLSAARDVRATRHLVFLTSGAAHAVYPGWTAYGAAKAGVDQWVRNAGAEQEMRGGVHVLAIAPGTVDTSMQAALIAAREHDFPRRQKFVELHDGGRLTDPDDVARDIWALLDRGLDNGSVVDLRELAPPR